MTDDSAHPAELGWTRVLHAIPIAACVADLRGGAVLRLNQAFTALTGHSAEDLPTLRSMGTLFTPATDHAEAGATWEDWVSRSKEPGGLSTPQVFRLHRKDETDGMVRTHLSATGTLGILSFEDLHNPGLEPEQARLPVELRQSGLPYRSLVEQALVGIFVLRGGCLRYVNPRFAQLLGYALVDLVDRRSLSELATATDTAAVERNLTLLGQGPDQDTRFVFAAVRGDGAIIDVEVTARVIASGQEALVLGAVSDVTDRVRTERQLEYLAFHDPLTGLPNRALLADRLNQAVKRARRYGQEFGLMVLDLDGFKAVNDTYGHEAGDAVLRIISQRLTECLRDSDTVARMGGDEFALVLQEVSERAVLGGLAERLVRAVGEPIDLGGTVCEVGASIGIALSTEHSKTMDVLLSRADTAMYAQKRAGTAGYTFFQAGVHPDAGREIPLIRWTADLDLGIALIDEHHRRLVELVNRLGTAVTSADEAPNVRALLDDLGDFTAEHFRAEEVLMDQHQFSHARAHKEQHRKLQDELAAIQHQIGSPDMSLTLTAVRNWLLAHIQSSDRELVRSLRQQGLR